MIRQVCLIMWCYYRCGNVAAILELDEHLQRDFTIFEAAPQVNIPYYSFKYTLKTHTKNHACSLGLIDKYHSCPLCISFCWNKTCIKANISSHQKTSLNLPFIWQLWFWRMQQGLYRKEPGLLFIAIKKKMT